MCLVNPINAAIAEWRAGRVAPRSSSVSKEIYLGQGFWQGSQILLDSAQFDVLVSSLLSRLISIFSTGKTLELHGGFWHSIERDDATESLTIERIPTAGTGRAADDASGW